MKLEFDSLSHKRQADLSWRGISLAFEARLDTAIKLQIVLSSIATPPKNTKIVTRDPNAGNQNHRKRSSKDLVFSQTVMAKEESTSYPSGLSETDTEVPGEGRDSINYD